MLHHMYTGIVATCTEWLEEGFRRLHLQRRRYALQWQLARFAEIGVPRIAWDDPYDWGDDAWARHASVSGDMAELPAIYKRTLRLASETMNLDAQALFVEMLHTLVAIDLESLVQSCAELRHDVRQILATTFDTRFAEKRGGTGEAVSAWLLERSSYFRRVGFQDPEIVGIMAGTALETAAAARFAPTDVQAFVASVVDQLQSSGATTEAVWEEARGRLEAGEQIHHILEDLGERGCPLRAMDYLVRRATVLGYVSPQTFDDF